MINYFFHVDQPGKAFISYKSLMNNNYSQPFKLSIYTLDLFFVGSFSSNYKLTIGVDFALKTLDWDVKSRINMQLWLAARYWTAIINNNNSYSDRDIAGHERFGHMTRVYYKYA